MNLTEVRDELFCYKSEFKSQVKTVKSQVNNDNSKTSHKSYTFNFEPLTSHKYFIANSMPI